MFSHWNKLQVLSVTLRTGAVLFRPDNINQNE